MVLLAAENGGDVWNQPLRPPGIYWALGTARRIGLVRYRTIAARVMKSPP